LNEDKLILEIPLTLRKQTVMRQIGQGVKKAYEGRVIDVMQFATARRKVLKIKYARVRQSSPYTSSR
jgi:hypothetical protein